MPVFRNGVFWANCKNWDKASASLGSKASFKPKFKLLGAWGYKLTFWLKSFKIEALRGFKMGFSPMLCHSKTLGLPVNSCMLLKSLMFIFSLAMFLSHQTISSLAYSFKINNLISFLSSWQYFCNPSNKA